MASGCTVSFLRKRFSNGDRVGCIMSVMVSAATFDISKAVHGIKHIDYFSVAARSLTTGGVQLNQNLASLTVATQGNLSGAGYSSGDNFVVAVFGI